MEETFGASGREARKRAEKRRRTVLNGLVAELAQLIPLVNESSRKVDKTSVLRLAAHEIRKEHVFGDAKPPADELTYEVAEAFLTLVEGFLMTMTTRGVIVVASPNVHAHLGHSQIDLLGGSLFALVHPDDARDLDAHLTPPDSESIESGRAERRDFVVRLARAGAKQEPPRYVPCRFRGGFKRAAGAELRASLGAEKTIGGGGGGGGGRRQRARRERLADPAGNDVVMVALVNVLRGPQISARLLEAFKEEYWTRHLVDGRIVHCEQRISIVAGYMSEEVTGVSAFTFMHKEDVRWVIIALRQMYDQNSPYGESCYRLIARDGRFIYMRTRGYLEIDSDTKSAHTFVCINSLMPDDAGERLIEDMKKRYSAIIDAIDAIDLDALTRTRLDDQVLEDPVELEQVIMCLIDKLPSLESCNPRKNRSIANNENGLTIIAPEPATIKSSIQKSLSIVSTKSGKRCATESSTLRSRVKRTNRQTTSP